MIGDLGFSCTASALDELGSERRRAMLADVAERVLAQITRPYPCAEIQTLTCDEDLSLPRERYCVFHGSFDWHSCVHSHWSLVRLAASGALDGAPDNLLDRVLAQLDVSLSPEPLAEEARVWAERIPAHEERPYGHTWLLMLDAELLRAARSAACGSVVSRARDWRNSLSPMTAEMLRRVRDWLAGLDLPVRSGLHTDTGWSLAMAWDWAREAGDEELAAGVRDAATRLFGRDVDAPVAYEPQGHTFTSSILNEAALMARVLEADAYEAWLRGFLPQAFARAGVEGASGAVGDARVGDAVGDTGAAGEVSVGGVASNPVAATCSAPGDAAAVCGATSEDPSGAAPAPTPLIADLPGTWDGSNYYGVHEVALPFSRSIAARDAAAALPKGSSARAYLAAQASRWMRQGTEGLTLDGYLADHWVGSFVVASLSRGVGA